MTVIKYINLLFLTILMFLSTISFGQSFKADELIKICKLDISDAETFLLSKGYTMSDTNDDSLKTVVDFENNIAKHAVRITKYKGILGIQDIEYTTMNSAEFIGVKNYLKTKQYKLEGTRTEKGNISIVASTYVKGVNTFWLYSFSTKEKGRLENWYRIQISIYRN